MAHHKDNFCNKHNSSCVQSYCKKTLTIYEFLPRSVTTVPEQWRQNSAPRNSLSLKHLGVKCTQSKQYISVC